MTTPLLALQVEADHTVLLDSEQRSVTLRVSPRTLAARHWPRGRPSPLQLERAIDDVEYAIEQAGLRHADRGLLLATGGLLQLLPQRFRSSGEFSRDDVEAEFSQLVAAAVSAVSDAELALNGESAAALLLLHEVMHHLGFQALKTDG